jgi:hypothetical protein
VLGGEGRGVLGQGGIRGHLQPGRQPGLQPSLLLRYGLVTGRPTERLAADAAQEATALSTDVDASAPDALSA